MYLTLRKRPMTPRAMSLAARPVAMSPMRRPPPAGSPPRTARRSWLIGIAIMVAAVMVVAGLWYISRWISTPLLHLAQVHARPRRNKTDIDLQGTERRDEIGEMARAAVVFQRNAIELMISQRGLAQQASMLEEKLAAEQQLSVMQRNFVSMASHEFRTPLTIIDGNARRLIKMNDRMPAKEVTQRAGRIRAAVLRMTHLMDNLLNSSRLVDHGAGLYFHPAEINLTAILSDVCQLHREIAPKTRIVEQFGQQPLQMSGDAKLLDQVFGNLLSNAIKYSPSGTPIVISAVVDGDSIRRLCRGSRDWNSGRGSRAVIRALFARQQRVRYRGDWNWALSCQVGRRSAWRPDRGRKPGRTRVAFHGAPADQCRARRFFGSERREQQEIRTGRARVGLPARRAQVNARGLRQSSHCWFCLRRH